MSCGHPLCTGCFECRESDRIEDEITRFEYYSENKKWLDPDNGDLEAIDQRNTGFSIERNGFPHDGNDTLSASVAIHLEILSDTAADAYERAAETLIAIAAECMAASHGSPIKKEVA